LPTHTLPFAKYDITALKMRALSCIRAELKNCDIVQEAFSEFASRLAHAVRMATIKFELKS